MTPDELRAAAIEKMKEEYGQLGWQWLTLRPNCGGPRGTPLEYTWGEYRRIKREYDDAMRLVGSRGAKYYMEELANESRGPETSDPKRPKRRTNSKRTKRPT